VSKKEAAVSWTLSEKSTTRAIVFRVPLDGATCTKSTDGTPSALGATT